MTILGAGGAAKAIAITAADSGAKQVYVVNRTLARAEALCAGEDRMEALPLDHAETVLPETDILINTTPMGMEGVTGAAEFPFLSALKPGAAAMDCIYAPAVTPFLAAATALGHPTANGLGMLIYQAVYAYGFFRELTFSPEAVTDLGARLREACRDRF